MKFSAQALLEQHGWKEGQGLGKEEQGIKEAIKVKLKKDKTGVGHDFGEEFTYHWWDHAFNTAAKKIKVLTSTDGSVELTKEGADTDLSTKKLSKKSKKLKKANKYDVFKSFGNFVKSGTLTDGKFSEHKKDDNEEEEEEDAGTVSKYSDDDLFRICGGLTAHKGARHGINLKGKLDRINQQEQNCHHHHQTHKQNSIQPSFKDINNPDNVSALEVSKSDSTLSKKKKKFKIKNMPCENIDVQCSNNLSDVNTMNDDNMNDDGTDDFEKNATTVNGEKLKKSRKRKKKSSITDPNSSNRIRKL